MSKESSTKNDWGITNAKINTNPIKTINVPCLICRKLIPITKDTFTLDYFGNYLIEVCDECRNAVYEMKKQLNKKDVCDKCKVECLGCGKVIESTYSNIYTLCEECYRNYQKIITDFNATKTIGVNGTNVNSNINKNIKYEIKGSIDNE